MARLGGVDLGATNLRAAVATVPDRGAASGDREDHDAAADAPPRPRAVERRRTPSSDSGTAVARAAADALAAAAEAADTTLLALDAVGVGTVGPLDRDAGAVVDPPNLAGVERIPLRGTLEARVGRATVVVENDAVAGLVGERAAMAEPPADLVYLTLSSGVGAGVAVDGHVLRGRAGNAAEVGHLVVEPDGRRCGCGGRGHWEAYAGGAALPDVAREVHRSAGLPTDLPLDEPRLDAAAVFDAAGRGDPVAAHVVERAVRATAVGLADLVAAYDPAVVVVGGGVALAHPERLVEPLPDRVAPFVLGEAPEVRPAALGDDAVLRGALELARVGGLEDA